MAPIDDMISEIHSSGRNVNADLRKVPNPSPREVREDRTASVDERNSPKSPTSLPQSSSRKSRREAIPFINDSMPLPISHQPEPDEPLPEPLPEPESVP